MTFAVEIGCPGSLVDFASSAAFFETVRHSSEKTPDGLSFQPTELPDLRTPLSSFKFLHQAPGSSDSVTFGVDVESVPGDNTEAEITYSSRKPRRGLRSGRLVKEKKAEQAVKRLQHLRLLPFSSGLDLDQDEQVRIAVY